jgi:hypothetical protein
VSNLKIKVNLTAKQAKDLIMSKDDMVYAMRRHDEKHGSPSKDGATHYLCKFDGMFWRKTVNGSRDRPAIIGKGLQQPWYVYRLKDYDIQPPKEEIAKYVERATVQKVKVRKKDVEDIL